MSRDDHDEMHVMARNSVVERTWAKVNSQLITHYEAVVKSPLTLIKNEQVA
jgi:hypothetical protein